MDELKYTEYERNIIHITVHRGDSHKTITCQKGENLLSVLNRSGYYLPAMCGLKGGCGKCGVRILEGEVAITPDDQRFFSRERLSQGFRLSCRVCPESDLNICLTDGESRGFEVLQSYTLSDVQATKPQKEESQKQYGIAVDIGTTTIVMQCIDILTGQVAVSEVSLNHQRAYGADVVSRMEASNCGKKKELQESIRNDLNDLLDRILVQAGKVPQRMVIAANTTMIHLLMGYSCETLGVAPFLPVNIEMITGSAEEILGRTDLTMQITILPAISTYVGADIMAGILACGMDQSREVCLFLDLGTNGEIAIGNAEKILVTSTAAGPAFEGGNISCGMGSIPGAISEFRIGFHGERQIKTIMDQEPCGICGTGVIDIMAELVRTGLVDGTGLLDKNNFDTGYLVAENSKKEKIVFTQKDIREIQLAKAAIRAGAETLMKRYGVGYEEISHVWIAGGFGFRLDKHMAVSIGMLPKELEDKVSAVGNGSLAGAVMVLRNADVDKRMSRIMAISREIALATDVDFSRFYMDAMYLF